MTEFNVRYTLGGLPSNEWTKLDSMPSEQFVSGTGWTVDLITASPSSVEVVIRGDLQPAAPLVVEIGRAIGGQLQDPEILTTGTFILLDKYGAGDNAIPSEVMVCIKCAGENGSHAPDCR